MAVYACPDSVVDAQWAIAHLGDPSMRWVEVVWGDSAEWGATAYANGHIPGAVAWDFATVCRTRRARMSSTWRGWRRCWPAPVSRPRRASWPTAA